MYVQLSHSITSADLLSVQTSYQQQKRQPLGHEIKANLSLVNYYVMAYPQAFFLKI